MTEEEEIEIGKRSQQNKSDMPESSTETSKKTSKTTGTRRKTSFYPYYPRFSKHQHHFHNVMHAIDHKNYSNITSEKECRFHQTFEWTFFSIHL